MTKSKSDNITETVAQHLFFDWITHYSVLTHNKSRPPVQNQSSSTIWSS